MQQFNQSLLPSHHCGCLHKHQGYTQSGKMASAPENSVWIEFGCLPSPLSPLPGGNRGPLCTHIPKSISAALGRWEQGTFLKMASRIFSLTWVMVSQFRIFTGISGLFTLSGLTQLRTWGRGSETHHTFHSSTGTPWQPFLQVPASYKSEGSRVQ